ncbi:MAG: CAP domain-containing protein [Microthrixaceae bacterium]|nr:hypothetical protein [Acidimicrobiales bacterium]
MSNQTSPRNTIVRFAAALAALAIFGTAGCAGAAPPTPSMSSEQKQVIDLVNQTRSQNGRKQLRSDAMLNTKATGWAKKLARECKLSHSNLRSGAPSDWQRLGENVGYAGSVADVHRAYLNSSGHRKNIMDGGFDRMGSGVAHGHCFGYPVVFTVQVFLDER